MILAALLFGSLASLPEKPTGLEVEWTINNFDATIVAKQVAAGDGCHVEVRRDLDQSILWQRDVCLGGRSDPKLLSANGLRLIVLASYPAVPKAAAHSSDRYPWRAVPVVWLFERGSLEEEGNVAQFVRDPTEVRVTPSHFEWMQGVNKVPGVPPRLNADGTSVELEAIDGTHRALYFSGLKLPPPAPFPEERHRRKIH